MQRMDDLNRAAERICGAYFGRLLVALQFLWLGVLLFIPPGGIELHSTLWAALSSAAATAAVVLAVWAYLSLGRSFRVRPEPLADATFVCSGIYRWIRHPMYTAVLALAFSMTLHTRSWIGVGAWCALALTLLAKSHYEDALWRRRDANATEYQRRVGRFLPRLRRLSS